jgi:hypothetical protein
VSRLPHLEEGDSVDDVLQKVVGARAAGIDPKELFGGPRDWIDSALPPIGFVAGNAIGGLNAGIWAAVAFEGVVVLVRLVRRETLRHAFSGALGVVIAVLFARATGQAKNFFVPGIVINAVYGVAFVLSVVFRRPVVGLIMRFVWEKPKEWHDHPAVRRAYAEATLLWALMFGVRAVVLETLRRLDKTGWLAIAKIAMGYPLYVAALALTVPYLKRRTASVPVPVPEPEAEAGGEDATDYGPGSIADGA